jgi:hypothetical protein
MMGTRFQAAIQGRFGKQVRVLHGADGIHFRMRPSEFMVVTLADNPVPVNDHTPHKGIGPGESQSFSRQLKTTAHVITVLFCQPQFAFYYI